MWPFALAVPRPAMVSISGIIQAPWDVHVAPIFYYRSALPVHTFEGLDLNADGTLQDHVLT